jgi:predicted ArsR family transcriptional regulator
MQEQLGFALAHASEIKTVFEQCGIDPVLTQRIDRVIRDYAASLPQQLSLQAKNQGIQAASSILQSDARPFFCADARQLSAEWVSSIEMMRQSF